MPKGSRARFEQVGDVIGGERAEFERVVEGAGGGLGAVGLAQRDDFAHVMEGIEASQGEFLVVLVGPCGEGDEALEHALGASPSALFEQGAGMVGMLEVAVSLVASPVSCDEPVAVVDAKPVGVAVEGEPGRGVLGGHGVAVGLEGDAEAVRGAHGVHRGDVVDELGQSPELVALFVEPVDGTLLGLAMDAHVGDGVEPVPARGVQGVEVGEVESGEEILFHVPHAGLDPTLLVTGADVARGDLEAVMAGEVRVAGVKHRRLADGALQHRGAKVVDHDPCGDA